MKKTREKIQDKARKEILKAKTADDLNKLIAKHLEILEQPGVTLQDIRLAESVSGLIGRQVSVENTKISYERLAAFNGKKYSFIS